MSADPLYGPNGPDLDLPFEPAPSGQQIPLDDALTAGGVVVMAVTVPVEGRRLPGVVFRFCDPHGNFYPPMLLVGSADQILKVEPLVYAAVNGAVTDQLDGLRRLDWVIAGGESGPGARPMHPDWARSLRDQCAAAGVPFLFKQWGEHKPSGAGIGRLTHRRFAYVGEPDEYGWRQTMERVGKKAAGRELDGRTWDEFPAVPA